MKSPGKVRDAAVLDDEMSWKVSQQVLKSMQTVNF